jgi:hypothetical protein
MHGLAACLCADLHVGILSNLAECSHGMPGSQQMHAFGGNHPRPLRPRALSGGRPPGDLTLREAPQSGAVTRPCSDFPARIDISDGDTLRARQRRSSDSYRTCRSAQYGRRLLLRRPQRSRSVRTWSWSAPEVLEPRRRQLGVAPVGWIFLWPRQAWSTRVSWLAFPMALLVCHSSAFLPN